MTNPFLHDVVSGPSQYRPEWDVPDLNAVATESLEQRLIQLRNNPGAPRKIPVLLATPGFGKTHLFGRIAHRQADEVLMVFVPQVEDPQRPLDHIRRAAVESLFRNVDGRDETPLEVILGRLCHESVRTYFHSLPAMLRTEHRQLGERLESDWTEVPRLMRKVKPLRPFLHLAESVASRHSQLRKSVVQALLLGWSPVKTLARRWLRGEELSEADLTRLELGQDGAPPSASEVLRAVAGLLPDEMPIVLCCDQLEAVLRVPDGLKTLANDLVGLLQDDELSNLLIVVSCLEDRWREAKSQGGATGAHTMFYDRVETLTLESPQPQQIVRLVQQRLQSWPAHRVDSVWPFDADSLREWARLECPSPRGTLKVCAAEFERWLEEGQPDQLIRFGGGPVDAIEDHFRREWERELSEIRRDDNRSYVHADEARINNALLATLELLQGRDAGRGDATGVTDIERNVISTTSAVPCYGHAVATSGADGAAACTILMLTRTEQPRSFTAHLEALERALDERDAHGILIHPRQKPPLGKTPNTKARKVFERLIDSNRLTYFPLVDHQDVYEQLECFWKLRSDAASGDLLVDSQRIDVDRFDQLVVSELKYLDHLRLLELVSGSIVSSGRGAEPAETPEDEPTTAEQPAPATSRSVNSSPPGTMDREEASPARVASAAASVVAVADPGTTGKQTEAVATIESTDRATDEWAAELLRQVVRELRNFNVDVAPVGVQTGARFARLTVGARGRTTVNHVRNRAEDLKIRLADVDHMPVIASQPDGISIDVQLPEVHRRQVTLGELRESAPERAGIAPVFPVGQDVAGRGYWADFSDANHAHYLVAGTTGSGKSEFLKSLMAGMAGLLGPDRLRFLPIDPKRVTFGQSASSPYFGPPGEQTGVAHTAEETGPLLEWCSEETERRYKMLAHRGVSDVGKLDPEDPSTPPRVIVVCDEFPDLISDPALKQELERFLVKTATKARAAGIHLVLAAQRPEAKVVTPQLRSNLPGRVCLRVSSSADSRIVLDQSDAADLLGRGDLFWKDGMGLRRLQAPLVSQDEFDDALRIR